MRGGHVVRVAGLAVADQPWRVGRHAGAFQQRETGGLADRDAVARGVERAARFGRHQLQRVKAEQHAVAQGVDAADHRRVDQAQADHPFGVGEHLGAGRAGGGNRQARALEFQRGGDEGGQRVRRVDRRAQHVVGEAAVGIEPAIGFLGGADAGSGRAQQQRHAAGAVARACGAHAFEEAVLVQAQPGQPVVAAIPRAKGGGQGDVFHAVDAADPAGQRRAADVVRTQPAARMLERVELCCEAAAHGGSGGIRGDREGCHEDGHQESLTLTPQNA